MRNEEDIGRGGFGEIRVNTVSFRGKMPYEGIQGGQENDKFFDKKFAYKENKQKEKKQNDRDRVQHEIEILKLLKDQECSQISKYFFSEQQPNKLFIEYYPCKDLDKYCNSLILITSLITKMEFMIQISQGIKFLSDRGFYHLDIKTSNVLVAKDQILKITDFGETFHSDVCEAIYKCNWDPKFQQINKDHLSKFWGRSIRSENKSNVSQNQNKISYFPAKTMPYCPPEGKKAELKINYQSDIFSLGVILSEQLLETMPFSFLKSKMKELEAKFDKDEQVPFLPYLYVVDLGPPVVMKALRSVILSCLKKTEFKDWNKDTYQMERPCIDQIIQVLSICKEYLITCSTIPLLRDD